MGMPTAAVSSRLTSEAPVGADAPRLAAAPGTPADASGTGKRPREPALARTGAAALLRSDPSVAAVSLLEVGDRAEELAASEVGPEGLGHPDLRVCDLPEQEVAHAELSARADEQIGIGDARGVQEAREGLFIEGRGVEASRRGLGQEPAAGVHDPRAPAVGERDVEEEPVVARSGLHAALELLAHGRHELLDGADDPKTDPVLLERFELPAEVLAQ